LFGSIIKIDLYKTISINGGDKRMSTTTVDLRIVVSVILGGLNALVQSDSALTPTETEMISLITAVLNAVLTILPASAEINLSG